MLKIFAPDKEGILKIAALEFQRIYREVTGKKLPILTEPDETCDLVVLGSDAVNRYVHDSIMDSSCPILHMRTRTDDYILRTYRRSGHTRLLIAGARPRALMYGVYRFFELRADCRYFWDGDIIPKKKTIDIALLDLKESPRFEYRGLRYFPHRSLHRFQAQQWGWEDWKQEIDYLLKKRFNLFWMRIGFDDLFQKAFPDVVPYTGFETRGAVPRSYDDHTLFWKLEYRGELRKKVLAYARERDLLHPEDVGTMTHWYTRTPLDYLDKVKPSSMPQSSKGYDDPSGQIWDIREDRNLDAYFKLTEAHIEHYGEPAIFHTMGLSERQCFSDRKQNQKMKLYTYRRIIDKLRGKYPSAPLLIGTWDFLVNWKPEEVRELIDEFDPSNTLILDYTTDINAGGNDLSRWGFVGKFPWIIGFFHGNEYRSEIHEHYDFLEERIAVAADDPFCKGMLLWPEHAHCDTFFLEYLAANAWNPESKNYIADNFVTKFCADRYPENREDMESAWRKGLAIFRKDQLFYNELYTSTYSRKFMNSLRSIYIADFRNYEYTVHRHMVTYADKNASIKETPEIFRLLAKTAKSNPSKLQYRDIIDLGKTILSSFLDYSMSLSFLKMTETRNGADCAGEVETIEKGNLELMELFSSMLGAHEDHSLYSSLLKMREETECNPDFEFTLKGNAENFYCRSYITELFRAIYIPEMKIYSKWIVETAGDKNRAPIKVPSFFEEKFKEIQDNFYAKGLIEFAPDLAKEKRNLPATLKKIEKITRRILDEKYAVRLLAGEKNA